MGRARLGFAIANDNKPVRLAPQPPLIRLGGLPILPKCNGERCPPGLRNGAGHQTPIQPWTANIFFWSPIIIRKPANQGNRGHQGHSDQLPYNRKGEDMKTKRTMLLSRLAAAAFVAALTFTSAWAAEKK